MVNKKTRDDNVRGNYCFKFALRILHGGGSAVFSRQSSPRRAQILPVKTKCVLTKEPSFWLHRSRVKINNKQRDFGN